jgi:lactoylglutathione lyase
MPNSILVPATARAPYTPGMAGVAFNHVGQCVTDLARSRRFYEELLGFTFDREISPPDDPSAKLLALTPPIGMTACYLRRDGLVLELLHYAAAGTTAPTTRVMNEPGLTHVSLSVDDIDTVCDRIPHYGGEVLTDTNIGFGVFVRDPDGQLIELLPMSYREQLDGA